MGNLACMSGIWGEGISGGVGGGGLGAQERDGNIKKKGEECKKGGKGWHIWSVCGLFIREVPNFIPICDLKSLFQLLLHVALN